LVWSLFEKKESDKDKTDSPIKKTITTEELPTYITDQLRDKNNFTYIATYIINKSTSPDTAPEIISKTHLFWDKLNSVLHKITENPSTVKPVVKQKTTNIDANNFKNLLTVLSEFDKQVKNNNRIA